MNASQKGPERIGDILSRVLAETGVLERRGQEEVAEAWREIAGPQVAGETQIVSFKRGRLTVAVRSAPLCHELELFQREELLKALRVRIKSAFVEELRFRLV